MKEKDFIYRVMPARNRLYRLALRILGSSDDAEDVVQETLVKIWRKNIDVSDIESVESFAFSCVKNLCLDKIKINKNRRKLLEINFKTAEQTATPEQTTENRDTMEKIKTIIAKLPEKQRIILHLRDIEGLTNGRISEIMGISNEAVRTNLSRARKYIREKLIKEYKYEYHEH
jgi:RNA polymerase sigma-70 factor (ECF subfamily)